MRFGCISISLLMLMQIFTGMFSPVLSKDNNFGIEETEATRLRLHREATELFSVKMRAELNSFQRCNISSEWYSYVVDEVIAKTEFDFHIHASLSAPNHGASLPDILDPMKLNKSIFCDKSDVASNRRSIFREFRNNFNTRSAVALFLVELRSYSFPLFNDNYTKALLVSGHTRWRWSRPDLPGVWEDTDTVEIYTKRNGIWSYTRNGGEINSDGTIETPE